MVKMKCFSRIIQNDMINNNNNAYSYNQQHIKGSSMTAGTAKFFLIPQGTHNPNKKYHDYTKKNQICICEQF